MVSQISQNIIATAHRFLPKTTLGRIALAVSGLAAAVFAGIVYIHFTRPRLPRIETLRESLTKIAVEAQEQSIYPFPLNNATYIAYSHAYEKGTAKTTWFMGHLKDAGDHRHIVSLIEDKSPQNFLKDYELQDAIRGEFLDTGRLGKKTIDHFHHGNDRGSSIAFINLARSVAEKKEVVFVTCETGLEQTAAFLALVEFIRDKRKNVDRTDDGLKQIMADILQSIARTARGRIPSRAWITEFQNPSFLRTLL